MKKYLGIAAMALALAGCASAPAANQPLGIASLPTASETSTAEPTPSVSYEGSYLSGADESAYIDLVHRDWQGATVPTDDELLAAGYEVCEAIQTDVAVDDQRFPEWSGLDNFAVHFAAGSALCPADA